MTIVTPIATMPTIDICLTILSKLPDVKNVGDRIDITRISAIRIKSIPYRPKRRKAVSFQRRFPTASDLFGLFAIVTSLFIRTSSRLV